MAAGPVEERERLELLDVLRGFALAGILLVNMRFFATPLMAAPEWPLEERFPGLADRVAGWAVAVLAEGKFYPLLALLFGYGFAVQLERWGSLGGRYARRLLGLGLLGIAHAVLLWPGDVLVAYAVVGAVLVLFRRRGDWELLAWVGALAFAEALVLAAGVAVKAALGPGETDAAEVAAAYGSGSYLEVTERRLVDAAVLLPSGILGSGALFLAMFLLGLWAHRRGVLARPGEHRRLLRTVLAVGLVGGGAASVAASGVAAAADGVVADAAGAAAWLVGPVLALGYTAGIVLLGRRLRPLAAVGRLALTNYLLQSALATSIFYGYGLGLFGEVGPAAGVGVAAAIYAALLAASVLWLRRFRLGPFEWALRGFTYLRRP